MRAGSLADQVQSSLRYRSKSFKRPPAKPRQSALFQFAPLHIQRLSDPFPHIGCGFLSDDRLPAVDVERKAQLEKYAQRHGQDPEAALDEVLAAALAWERLDYEQAVAGIRERFAEFQAGRTRPAAILEWLLAHEAGETGPRWFRNMKEAVASVSELPHRCSLAPENQHFPFEVRQLSEH